MKRTIPILCMCALLLSPFGLLGQPASVPLEPTDLLSKQFHKERREALRKMMPPNSVGVFFANPIRNRANDVDYHYHQDPDFYYLTGLHEPDALLLIYSTEQVDEKGNKYNEAVFIQPKNPRMEMWTGKRMGVEGVQTRLGIEQVFENRQFFDYNLDKDRLDKIMFFNFQNDVRDDKGDSGDLYSLIAQFKEKVDYPGEDALSKQAVYEMIKSSDGNLNRIRYIVNNNPTLKEDQVLKDFLQADDEIKRKKILETLPQSKLDNFSLDSYLNKLREIKLPEEMSLLRKAIDISCIAQTEVMKAMHPNMSETEIQGIHEYVFKKYGSEYEGYPSIVGAGHNGCVLHYITNNKPVVGNDLVLMDLGAEYHGYTADITRTIPANGKFTPEQKLIYELVLEAQEAGIKACKPGNSFNSTHIASSKVINEGLVKLGIIKAGQTHSYFPHGTSHYLGLDVHDRGTYNVFQPGVVITVEPGIYIPENSPCDPRWWGIAVRIEDDILITENGYEMLSDKAPRTVEEIERVMAMPSPLDDFTLPSLEEKK